MCIVTVRGEWTLFGALTLVCARALPYMTTVRILLYSSTRRIFNIVVASGY